MAIFKYVDKEGNTHAVEGLILVGEQDIVGNNAGNSIIAQPANQFIAGYSDDPGAGFSVTQLWNPETSDDNVIVDHIDLNQNNDSNLAFYRNTDALASLAANQPVPKLSGDTTDAQIRREPDFVVPGTGKIEMYIDNSLTTPGWCFAGFALRPGEGLLIVQATATWKVKPTLTFHKVAA